MNPKRRYREASSADWRVGAFLREGPALVAPPL